MGLSSTHLTFLAISFLVPQAAVGAGETWAESKMLQDSRALSMA